MTSDPLSDPLIKAAPATFEMACLVSALSTSYGLAGTLEPLAGERDRNLKLVAEDGATYLVKLAHPAEDVAITDFQTAALLHFEAGGGGAGLPVPRVIRTAAGEALRPSDCGEAGVSQLRVLSFLPGEPMARLEVGRAQYRSFGGFAARLVEALSGFSHPADGRRLLWDIREVSCFRRLLLPRPLARARPEGDGCDVSPDRHTRRSRRAQGGRPRHGRGDRGLRYAMRRRAGLDGHRR